MKPDLKGLTKLAGVLRRVDKKHFNMGHWWYSNDCGTSGCIAGHAATIFPSRFKYVGDNETGFEVVHKASGLSNSMAFARGFRIPQESAEKIVYSNWRSPTTAANAVMRLVKRLGKQSKVKA